MAHQYTSVVCAGRPVLVILIEYRSTCWVLCLAKGMDIRLVCCHAQHLWQRCGVIRRVDLWVEEELRPKKALICHITSEVLASLGVVACVGLQVFAWLLIVLVELLQNSDLRQCCMYSTGRTETCTLSAACRTKGHNQRPEDLFNGRYLDNCMADQEAAGCME